MIPGLYRSGVGAARANPPMYVAPHQLNVRATRAPTVVPYGIRGLGQASADLSAFNNSVAAGDQYLASGVTDGNVLGEFSSAVQAYQAGASAAVTSLGPAIDAQTNGASQSLTSQAATIYTSQLSPITATGAAQADATNASLYAHAMQALYTTAIALPPSGGPTASPGPGPVTAPPGPVTAPPGPTLAPTPTAAPATSSSALPWILGGAAVVGVGVVGWMMLRKRTPMPRRLTA